MAKPGQAQDEAMDAILASIRSMMSEDGEGALTSRPEAVDSPKPLPDNVSKLFAEGSFDEPDSAPDADEDQPTVRPGSTAADTPVRTVDRVIGSTAADVRSDTPMNGEEPIRQAPGNAVRPTQAPDRAFASLGPLVTESDAARSRGDVPTLNTDDTPAKGLLSPEVDAIVSQRFGELASAMLSGSGRTVDGMVEDLLRPMLKDWLDANLPPMVERLVREEIERVSRGRR